MKPFLLMLSLSLLAGCSILPKSEPLDIYLLPATSLSSQDSSVDWSLRVSTPSSGQLLDGARIVVLPDASRVNAYQGVRWSEPTPELLRNRLLDGFRDDGRIQALSSDKQNLSADLNLVSSLRRFHSQYQDGGVVVQIQLDAQLVNVREQNIVASRRFNVTQLSDSNQIESVIRAFGEAADELTRQVVSWTLDTGTAAAVMARNE